MYICAVDVPKASNGFLNIVCSSNGVNRLRQNIDSYEKTIFSNSSVIGIDFSLLCSGQQK